MISALSFNLFEEAFELGGAARARVGLVVAAGTFVVVNTSEEFLQQQGPRITPEIGGTALVELVRADAASVAPATG